MTKRTQLVTQYLENVSRKALEKYQSIIREYVGRRQGIYALYRKDKLYYVGLASNLRSRLRQHLSDRHGNSWDRFSVYLTLNSSQLRELESLALRIVMPKGNKQMGKFCNADDLRRTFKRDVQKHMDIELDALILKRRSRGKQQKNDKKAAASIRSKRTGKVPILSAYAKKPARLVAKWKGKKYKALVMKDGAIKLDGNIYNSPSVAGFSIVKHAVDGWHFWKYERGPGEWVKLDELRK
jgi:hypothetical protein